MLEIKVTLEAPALAEAINNLAGSLKVSHVSDADVQMPPAGTAAMPASPASAMGASQPAVTAPIQQNAAVQQPVAALGQQATQPEQPGTAPRQYTLEELSNAGAKLVDAGKMPQIMALIQKYGVQAINQLNPAVYGQFAADLAALGAKFD